MAPLRARNKIIVSGGGQLAVMINGKDHKARKALERYKKMIENIKQLKAMDKRRSNNNADEREILKKQVLQCFSDLSTSPTIERRGLVSSHGAKALSKKQYPLVSKSFAGMKEEMAVIEKAQEDNMDDIMQRMEEMLSL